MDRILAITAAFARAADRGRTCPPVGGLPCHLPEYHGTSVAPNGRCAYHRTDIPRPKCTFGGSEHEADRDAHREETRANQEILGRE